MGALDDFAAYERWLDIAREFRYGEEWKPSQADVDHSALLKRLKSGKEPFRVPPPRRYSYPWYELIEEGRYYFNDRIFSEVFFSRPTGYASIAQDAGWRIRGSEPWVLSYTGSDVWEIRAVEIDDLVPTGGFKMNDAGEKEPIYATHVLLRTDEEEVW